MIFKLNSRNTSPASFKQQVSDTMMYYPHLVLIIGPLLLAYAFFVEHEQKYFLENSIEVPVHIVEVQNRRDDGVIKYRPVFEVHLKGGDTIRHSGNIWLRPSPHDAGDIVPGRYLASTGKIASYEMLAVESRNFDQMKLGGIAAFMLGIGILLFRRLRERRKR